MTDDTTATVTDNTTNTASSDVQAETSLLNQALPEEEATDKPTGETEVDAAKAGETDPNATTEEQPEGKTEEEAKDGPPEKYEFTAPEGVELDPAAVAEFEPIARELGLSNEKAQKLVNMQAALVQKQHEQWNQTVDSWVGTIKADKEIGGTHMRETITHAQKAISTYGTPELKAALDSTKMGNHPELVRVFARIGKAMADDKFISDGKPVEVKKTVGQALYPNLPQS